ncbi:hypothetical protein [Streptomyces sp. NPDC055210]
MSKHMLLLLGDYLPWPQIGGVEVLGLDDFVFLSGPLPRLSVDQPCSTAGSRAQGALVTAGRQPPRDVEPPEADAGCTREPDSTDGLRGTVMRGSRITLTNDIEALGTRHRAGDRGTVEEIHTCGHLTVRMDDGRPNFPTQEEVSLERA